MDQVVDIVDPVEEHWERSEDLCRQGLYDSAVEEMDRAIRLDPGRVESYTQLVEVCEGGQQWERGIAALHAAIRLEPDNVDHYRNLAYFCVQAGHHDEAAEAYRQAYRMTPDQPWNLAMMADSLVDARRHDEAITAYAELLNLAPDDASAHAIDEGPEWTRACCYFALLLRKTGLFEEFVVRLRKAVSSNPDLASFP